jgi:hypothetical protein
VLFEIAPKLYEFREEVKANQADLKRLLDRCQVFENFLFILKQEPCPEKLSSAVQSTVKRLLTLLEDV